MKNIIIVTSCLFVIIAGLFLYTYLLKQPSPIAIQLTNQSSFFEKKTILEHLDSNNQSILPLFASTFETAFKQNDTTFITLGGVGLIINLELYQNNTFTSQIIEPNCIPFPSKHYPITQNLLLFVDSSSAKIIGEYQCILSSYSYDNLKLIHQFNLNLD